MKGKEFWAQKTTKQRLCRWREVGTYMGQLIERSLVLEQRSFSSRPFCGDIAHKYTNLHSLDHHTRELKNAELGDRTQYAG